MCDDWGERREGRCEKHVPTDLEAGAECGESPDLKCGKGLTCSKLVSLFHMFRNICYDKTTSLKVGDKCDKDEAAVDDRVRNPNEGYPFPKCFIPAEDEKNPLKCLPKGKGLACQEEARLFEHCDAKEHIVCERGLVCSPAMSICLGADEIV